MAIITQSIGSAVGRDFSSIQAWEDALPVDFVALGNSYVGEVYNDSEFTFNNATALTIAGSTTSATNTLTLRAAAGQSYKDHANRRSNPLYYNASSGVGLRQTVDTYSVMIVVQIPYVTIEGLQLDCRRHGKPLSSSASNLTLRNMVVLGGGGFARMMSIKGAGNLIQNVVLVKVADGSAGVGIEIAGGTVENSTIVNLSAGTDSMLQGDYGTLTVRNCAILGPGGFNQRGSLGTCSNNATSNATAPGTSPLHNVVLANCFTNASTDFRLKTNSPLINAGAALGATTDTTGRAREGSYDIGAWEYIVAEQPVPAGHYRYIKMEVTANNGDTQFTGFQELQLRETYGGADATAPGMAYLQSSYYTPDNAHAGTLLDGDLTTVPGAWTTAMNAPFPHWVAFDLVTPKKIVEAALLRMPESWANGRHPTAFRFLGSNTALDAVDYVELKAFTGISAWLVGSNTIVELVAPPVAAGPPTFVSATMVNASSLEYTFSKELANIIPAASAFPLPGKTIGNVAVSGTKVTLSGIAPAYTLGETITTGGYVKPATNPLQATTSEQVESFGSTSVTNIITNKPTLAGYTVKTFGDNADDDFATPAAVATYIRGLTLTASDLPIMIYCRKNLDLGGNYNIGPNDATDSVYVTVSPAPGQGYSELEADNAPSAFGTVGLELTISNHSTRVGCVYDGWRVRHTTGTVHWRRDGWGQGTGGNMMGLRNCRVLVTTPDRPFQIGEYAAQPFFDNTLMIFAAGSFSLAAPFRSVGGGRARMSTFVRMDAGVTVPLCENAGGSFGDISGCLFAGMGDNPNQNAAGSKNYSNVATWSGASNLSYVSGNFFVSASDYRPATGSPMIGGAPAAYVSTNDNHGNNRGPNPDAGSTQLNPAEPLIKASVTSDYTVNGEEITISGTYTGTPTSASASVLPANPANGASAQGPLAITYSGGVWSIKFSGLSAGNYNTVFTFTNGGGISQAGGAQPFEVMGLEAASEDVPTATTPATAFTWNPPTTGIAGTNSTEWTVFTDGTLASTVRFTPSDGGAGGEFIPTFLDFDAAVGSGKLAYRRPTVGTSTLSATNNGGLTNPTPVSFVASDANGNGPAPTPAPTLDITTPPAEILSGDVARLAGTCTLHGAPDAALRLYVDAASGTTGPFTVPVTNNLFSLQRPAVLGVVVYRLVATAHNQTVTKSTVSVETLALNGNPRLPA